MSDAQVIEARAQIRKERIHTTMLIELLVLLVFLAMAYAFITREQSDPSFLQAKINSLTEQLKAAEVKIADLEKRNRELLKRNSALEESLRRWMEAPKDKLPANDQPIVMPKSQFDKLTDQLANAEAMVQERQKENADLRGQLAAARGGGTDLPNCTVTSGFLLSVDLLADGRFRVRPLWSAGSEDAARAVPGVPGLVAGRSLSADEFRQQARAVASWGKTQATPCGFRAQVTEKHGDLTLYKRQVRVVEETFYVRRN